MTVEALFGSVPATMTKDYTKSPVPVYSPDQFMELLKPRINDDKN